LSGSAVDVFTCTPSLVLDKVVWRILLEDLQGHKSGL
jgi:hypothetical protein